MNNETLKKVPLKISLCLILSIVVLVAAVDQYTKHLAVAHIPQHATVNIIPNFFNLTLVYNPGVAFGMFSDLSEGSRSLVLGAIILCSLVLVIFLFFDYYHDLVAQGALALILGGAIGNIIDRFLIGKVVDFLDFFYGTYHWPAFNIADMAICIGVALIILRRPAKHKAADTDNS